MTQQDVLDVTSGTFLMELVVLNAILHVVLAYQECVHVQQVIMCIMVNVPNVIQDV